eukprot:jgi/Bigna1/146886/aug1.123_g21594
MLAHSSIVSGRGQRQLTPSSSFLRPGGLYSAQLHTVQQQIDRSGSELYKTQQLLRTTSNIDDRNVKCLAQLDDGKIAFTDAQISRFLKARKEVKSGSGDAYWQKIADRVGDGITGYECKRLAQDQLFKKAAGTSTNFFKNFVDVKGEYVESGYVDENAADPMTQFSNFFGFGKKKEVSPDGFYVGQNVQYKSATFNKWVDAKVERLNKDGTVDLNCRDRANPKLIRAA